MVGYFPCSDSDETGRRGGRIILDMESFPIVAESYSNMQFFSSDDGTAMGNATGSRFPEDFRLHLHL
jgi:hypothetical protein